MFKYIIGYTEVFHTYATRDEAVAHAKSLSAQGGKTTVVYAVQELTKVSPPTPAPKRNA